MAKQNGKLGVILDGIVLLETIFFVMINQITKIIS